MTQKNSNHEFEEAVSALKSDVPGDDQVRAAAARLWIKVDGAAASQPEVIRGCEDVVRLLPQYVAGQLTPDRTALVKAHLRECAPCRHQAAGREVGVKWAPAAPRSAWGMWPRLGVVAAVVVIAIAAFLVHNTYFAVPAGARGTIATIDGIAYRITPDSDRVAVVGEQLNEDDTLRTSSGSHAFVKLADGSMIEVNERTDFTVQARGRNTTLALDRGSVIVQAAKRTSGHLYVKTPDARIAVTGTIFAVGSGVKGSRVSVVEGTVEVTHGGSDDILHAGDQVVTGDNMDTIPVADDIAWSRDREKHVELLAQFAKLQRRLEQVQLPAPRYQSDLLGRMPTGVIFYASIPNAGQALEDANRILQEQIQQSAALREWWTHGNAENQDKFNEMIAKIRQLSDYLGDEVVVIGFDQTSKSQDGGIAIIADVRRSGLPEFLQTQFSSDTERLTVINENQLASLPDRSHGPVALIRDSVVIFSGSRDTLSRVNQQLASGAPALTNTDFGRTIADAYTRGAGFFFAADLQRLMNDHPRRATARNAKSSAGMNRSGFADMKYLMVEHRELQGVPENRMVLDFSQQRRGVASWLAAPAPMGSLEFVSRNASIAFAFLAKEPEQILDDILSMDSNHAKSDREMAEAEQKLNLRIREDLVAHFGGDAVFALDGPVLPTPSWKLVIEVHDAPGLAVSLEKVVQAINTELQSKGKPTVQLASEEVSGQRYYTLTNPEKATEAMHFTFSNGYMIIGPTRAVVMQTLRTRMTGDSLARSAQFKSLLPKDSNANYSAIAYQNLAPVAGPLLQQFSGDQAKALQSLIADSRPSVICAWGRDNRIEAVTNSRLLGFDWLTLGTLFGTTHKQNP